MTSKFESVLIYVWSIQILMNVATWQVRWRKKMHLLFMVVKKERKVPLLFQYMLGSALLLSILNFF